MGTVEYLFLLIFLVFVYALEILAHSFAFSQHRLLFWVLSAISTPLGATFISLVLLAAIHLPISAICKCHKQHQYRKRRSQVYREDDPKTINRSNVIDLPSHTTWDPPHSSFDDVPFVEMQ